jgi:hypothetical protein
MSVPSGSVGFGRDPGRRKTLGIVDGGVVVAGDDVLAPGPVVFVPVVDFDDEQPASSATATPAPAIAIPFNTDRRLSESIALVYRARTRRARQ